MKNLIFLLEERSAEAMLKGFLPNVLPRNVYYQFIVFQGKQDLENKLYHRLSEWNMPESVFVVLLDQDNEDCKDLKNRLIKKCKQLVKSKKILFRIACHELESWYFGDLKAVDTALNKKLVHYSKKAKYRTPDKIKYPCTELQRITRGVYQKISGSRVIGPQLSLEKNKSKSFCIFIKGIQDIIKY